MSISLNFRSSICRVMLAFSIFYLPSFEAKSKTEVKKISSETFFQDQKPKKTKDTKKAEPAKPDVKEVPKSRRQPKPAVVKPQNVKPKVKPVKIVHPKIKRH